MSTAAVCLRLVCILASYHVLNGFVPRHGWNLARPRVGLSALGGEFEKRRGPMRKPKKRTRPSKAYGMKKSKGKIHRPKQPQIRRLVTDYDENRSDSINRYRLSSHIGCEHFGHCPGCVVSRSVGNLEVIESAKLFFSSSMVRKHRMDVHSSQLVVEEADDGFFQVVVPSALQGWRTQAKLPATPKSSSWVRDGCAFGLYKRGTHDVMTIPNCEVHHAAINKAISVLEEATEKAKTSAFDDLKGEGSLRYVQTQVERGTGKVCLTLVWFANDLKGTQPAMPRLLKELRKIAPDLWHSIWVHCNDGPGNNIFSRNRNKWNLMWGPEFVREPLPVGDQGWLYFSPLTFRQGNMDGFDVIAVDVAKKIPGGSRVCELYAGVGVLGLTALAHHAQQGQQPLTWIRCSDENPSNARCFQRSVGSLPKSVSHYKKEEAADEYVTLQEFISEVSSNTEQERTGKKASYRVATASEALFEGQALGADVLVVDPPRRGLEEEVLLELCKPVNQMQTYTESRDLLLAHTQEEKVNWTNDVSTIVYVSCGFDALARDAEKLISSAGGWMVESATGYVLFPGSDHVETVCVFKRRI